MFTEVGTEEQKKTEAGRNKLRAIRAHIQFLCCRSVACHLGELVIF